MEVGYLGALAFAGVFIALNLYAALSDIDRLKIPNWVSLAVIGVWAAKAAVFWPGMSVVGGDVLAAGAVFLGGFLLFAFRIMGAGDVKLFAAGSLFLGQASAVPFLVAMILAGGVLAALALLARLMKGRLLLAAKIIPKGLLAILVAEEKPPIPYGVAIAVGATIVQIGLLMGAGWASSGFTYFWT